MRDSTPPVRDTTLLQAGDVLGRYELLLPIARGGMGQVWAARLHGTRGFQKLVAVKTILPTDDDPGKLESMLFEEAALASLIRHPNVVETLDLGERDDGLMYLAMEWVAGESLDTILRTAASSGGVPLPLVVHFISQALLGLEAAHEARDAKGEKLGLVHRDISPQNLLVTYAGVVKLIDFGVAKTTQQVSQPTEEGVVKGKFAYMAPEQLRSEPLDARADLFAMGIVLYRAATGTHPFHANNMAATIHAILTHEPSKPSEIARHCPQDLDAVIMRALAKDRDARFASAHEMMIALERTVDVTARGQAERASEAFMRRLFERRMADRDRSLKAALAAADRGWGGKSSEPGLRLPRSQPTMRAVSYEARLEEGPEVAAPSAPVAHAAVAPSRRRGRGMWVALPLVAVTGGVLALVSVHHGRRAGRVSVSAVLAAPAPSILAPAPRLTGDAPRVREPASEGPAPGGSAPDGGAAAAPVAAAAGGAPVVAGHAAGPKKHEVVVKAAEVSSSAAPVRPPAPEVSPRAGEPAPEADPLSRRK
jgi:eukaryotic-like serine/threonine-protein kinase